MDIFVSVRCKREIAAAREAKASIILACANAKYISDPRPLQPAVDVVFSSVADLLAISMYVVAGAEVFEIEIDTACSSRQTARGFAFEFDVETKMIPSKSAAFGLEVFDLQTSLSLPLSRIDVAQLFELRVLQQGYSLVARMGHALCIATPEFVLYVVFAAVIEKCRHEIVLAQYRVKSQELSNLKLKLSVSSYYFCFLDAILYGYAKNAAISKQHKEHLGGGLLEKVFNADADVAKAVQECYEQFGQPVYSAVVRVKLGVSGRDRLQANYLTIGRRLFVFSTECLADVFRAVELQQQYETVYQVVALKYRACLLDDDAFCYLTDEAAIYERLPAEVSVFCLDLATAQQTSFSVQKSELLKMQQQGREKLEIAVLNGKFVIQYRDAKQAYTAQKGDAWSLMFGYKAKKQMSYGSIVLYRQQQNNPIINFAQVDYQLVQIAEANRRNQQQSEESKDGGLRKNQSQERLKEQLENSDVFRNQSQKIERRKMKEQMFSQYNAMNMSNYQKIVVGLKRESPKISASAIPPKMQQIGTPVSRQHRILKEVDDDLRKVSHIKYSEQFKIRSFAEIKDSLNPVEEYIDIAKLNELSTAALPLRKPAAQKPQARAPPQPITRRYAAGTQHYSLITQFSEQAVEQLREKSKSNQALVAKGGDVSGEDKMSLKIQRLVARMTGE